MERGEGRGEAESETGDISCDFWINTPEAMKKKKNKKGRKDDIHNKSVVSSQILSQNSQNESQASLNCRASRLMWHI